MPKPRASNLPWDARAADALAGRSRPDAADLLDLIHDVNPTGRGRDTKESTARYALKSRLQSLLVARFPDELVVVLDPDQEGVVSLQHRSRQRDACHAVIDALDDDARSWVRLQLDLGAGDGNGADSDAAPAVKAAVRASAPQREDDALTDPEEILRAGSQAEEEFDFERAQRLYLRAFEEGKSTRTALALLRFLVDVIAADAEALALEPELPAATRANPAVRVLLGLAAARSGDDERAMKFVAEVHEPRATETLVNLGRRAVARGDAETAARRLHEAEAADPAHPDVRALASEIDVLRAADRAPFEAEIGRLLAAGAEGGDAEATAKVSAILARWPESEPARRAARILDARRQADDGRRLLTEAEAARGRGEVATALLLFQRALATGATLGDEERARARHAIDELVAEEREKEAAHRVAHVVASLGEGERARGLTGYVELDDALRSRVREIVCVAALEWLDAVGPARSGGRAKAAVDAVLALERAAPLAASDAAATVALLAPHERVLENVPFARDLLERAHANLKAERRQHARGEIRAAEAALAAGNASLCGELLDRAERDLGKTDVEHTDANELRRYLAAFVDKQRLIRRFERARASHQYLDARLAVEALAASEDDPTKSQFWAAEAQAETAVARRERCVHVYDVEGGAELSRGVCLNQYTSFAQVSVDLRNGVVWMATVGQHMFARAFDLGTGRMVRCVYMRAPVHMREPQIQISGEHLLVTGNLDGVLELAFATGDPIRWVNLWNPSAPERECTSVIQPTPGSRLFWVIYNYDDQEGVLHDVGGERQARELPGATDFFLMPGMVPPRVAAKRNTTVCSLHEPSGPQTARIDFPGEVWAIAPHPAGDGMVAAFERGKDDEDSYSGVKPTLWGEISPRGVILRSEVIEGIASYPIASIASARDPGMAFIRFRNEAEEPQLLALQHVATSPGAPSLRFAYCLPLGPNRVLVQDQDGRRVFIVGTHDDGIDVIELGPEPPALPVRANVHAIKFPLKVLMGCMEPHEWSPLNLYVAHFKRGSPSEIRRRARELWAQREGDRAGLLDVVWALTHSDDLEGPGEFSAILAERYPDDPEVRQAVWVAIVARREWPELCRVLGEVDPASLPEGHRKHYHHLLAAGSLGIGDVDAAARHLKEAEPLPGKCDLVPLRASVEAAAEPLPGLDVPTDLPTLRQLLAIIAAADAHLAQGNYAAVIQLFERSLPWELTEVQSLARLAEAHLALPVRGESERLRKAVALGAFVDSHRDPRVGITHEVLPLNGIWSRERLDAIAARGAAWFASADEERTPSAL